MQSRPRHVNQRRNFVIVTSEYNKEFVHGLYNHAKSELEAVSSNFYVDHYEVPGAFEIPLLVQEVAAREGVDAVIALGVIIEGETAHASLIGTAVTNALMQISLSAHVPVIHEVLLVQNADQARQRCLEEEHNRGTEAARSAVRMVEILADLGTRGH